MGGGAERVGGETRGSLGVEPLQRTARGGGCPESNTVALQLFLCWQLKGCLDVACSECRSLP